MKSNFGTVEALIRLQYVLRVQQYQKRYSKNIFENDPRDDKSSREFSSHKKEGCLFRCFSSCCCNCLYKLETVLSSFLMNDTDPFFEWPALFADELKNRAQRQEDTFCCSHLSSFLAKFVSQVKRSPARKKNTTKHIIFLMMINRHVVFKIFVVPYLRFCLQLHHT